MNIKEIIKISTNKLTFNKISSASLDAEILLLEVLNKNRNNRLNKSWLYAHDDYILNKKEKYLFNYFINQRIKHKPVAYIIKQKEFFGYNFYIDKNVLIPRNETEFMVEEILKIIYKTTNNDKLNLIDIGTGSGCIIISILNELTKNKKDKKIYNAYANDISSKAIKIAKNNAKRYKLEKNIKFVINDFENFVKDNTRLFSNRFILTANLPYIKNNEYKNLLPNVKKYEPKISLVGGKDGLDLIKKLIKLLANTKTKTNLSNYIILEANPNQILKIKLLLKENLNIINYKVIKDLRNKDRHILAEIKTNLKHS